MTDDYDPPACFTTALDELHGIVARESGAEIVTLPAA